jgi:hypothetical protein
MTPEEYLTQEMQAVHNGLLAHMARSQLCPDIEYFAEQRWLLERKRQIRERIENWLSRRD